MTYVSCRKEGRKEGRKELMARMGKGDRTVSVTITMPLSVCNGIDEEALVMGVNFSPALVRLVMIGLDNRRVSRLPAEGRT